MSHWYCRNRGCRNSGCRNSGCRNSGVRNSGCLPYATVLTTFLFYFVFFSVFDAPLAYMYIIELCIRTGFPTDHISIYHPIHNLALTLILSLNISLTLSPAPYYHTVDPKNRRMGHLRSFKSHLPLQHLLNASTAILKDVLAAGIAQTQCTPTHNNGHFDSGRWHSSLIPQTLI